eukprot:SAG11_NODE_8492_length_1009_cov_1.520879_1_plen_46_part_10
MVAHHSLVGLEMPAALVAVGDAAVYHCDLQLTAHLAVRPETRQPLA